MRSQDGEAVKTASQGKSARSQRTPKGTGTSPAGAQAAPATVNAPLPVDIAWGLIAQGVEALRQHGHLHAQAVLYLDGIIEMDDKTLKQPIECFVAAITPDGKLIGPNVPCWSGERHPATAFELRNGSGWCTACDRAIEPPEIGGLPVSGSPALEAWG